MLAHGQGNDPYENAAKAHSFEPLDLSGKKDLKLRRLFTHEQH